MKLPEKITIKATIVPVHALRMIEVKIRLMKCKCWPYAKHRRTTFVYFKKDKNRYFMRNPHGKEEEWFDY